MTGHRLPAIGFGMASDGVPLSARELDLWRWMRLDTLRADVHLNSDYSGALELATESCQALNCYLELAVFVTEESADELDRLASFLLGRARVVRFLIFQEGAQTAHPSETTAPELVELTSRTLEHAAPRGPVGR